MIESNRSNAFGRKHGFGKECGILIVADRRTRVPKLHEPQSLPCGGVLRSRERDSRAVGPERRVRHHVLVQHRKKRDARILAAVSRLRAHLVRSLRFQREAEALDLVPLLAFEHVRALDARDVALLDDAWEEERSAVARSRERGIQHALGLFGRPVGGHHRAKTFDSSVEPNRLCDLHLSLAHRYGSTVSATGASAGVTTST